MQNSLNYFMLLRFRYVRQHYKNHLNDTPNYNYLGHPINAYHFIRHVAHGWPHVHQLLTSLSETNSTSLELGNIHESLQNRFWNPNYYVLTNESFMTEYTYFDFIDMLRKVNTNMLPDDDDIKGAASGIIRLFSEYR